MLHDKIDVVHYNRKGEKIDLYSKDNKDYMEKVVKNI